MRLVHDSFRALTAALAVLTLAVAGCGGDDTGADRPASLVWDDQPTLFVHPTLKDDRILRGEVKNGGLDKLRIETADVTLLDADGRQVPGAVTFAPGYVHSLYTANRLPRGGYPEEEKLRIGKIAVIQPGKSATLTVSWREPSGVRTPVRIDYGRGSLEIGKVRRGSSGR